MIFPFVSISMSNTVPFDPVPEINGHQKCTVWNYLDDPVSWATVVCGHIATYKDHPIVRKNYVTRSLAKARARVK